MSISQRIILQKRLCKILLIIFNELRGIEGEDFHNTFLYLQKSPPNLHFYWEMEAGKKVWELYRESSFFDWILKSKIWNPFSI